MGLVSYLKDLYYNSRLNKASNLLTEGRSSEAEQILTSILDKHPMAVAKLAEYYYSLSKSADVAKIVSLFEKILSLESKGGKIYDAKAYNGVLSKLVNDILSKAQMYFASSSYADCSALLSSINKTKCKSEETISLCCESDINVLLQKIGKSNSADKNFESSIEELKYLWSCAKSISKIKSRIKETIIKLCSTLSTNRRHYCAANVLGIVLENKYHKDCLSEIAHVILGDDSEANPKIIRDVVINYGRQLILRKNIATSETVSLFEKCWQHSSDCIFVIDVLDADISIDLRNAIVTHIINNHQTYLTNSELFKSFTNWISKTYGENEAIELYEKIYNVGYNVEDLYVSKVHSLIGRLSYDLKIVSLNKARTLYPKSKIILTDTLDCAKWYESQGENAIAIQISDSIISEFKEAKVIKAKALCNIGNKESNTDKRRQYIEQAFSELGNSKEEGAEDVRQYLQKSYLDVAEQYYSAGDADNCYTLIHSLAKQKYNPSLISLAGHRLSEANKYSDNTEKLSKINDAIDEINTYDISAIVDTSEYRSLWSEKINSTIEICRTKENNSAIAEFEKLISSINAVGFDNVYATTKCTLLQNNIIERKYIIARELEKGNKLHEAATAYKEINALEKKRVPTLSALRFILCKLKLGDTSDILQHKDKIYSLLKNAAQAFKAEKDDIAYRFSLALLKAGEDKEALSILADYLPNEIQLKKACEQGAMIKAQAKLDDFNQKLEAVKNKTLSSSDAVYFINHMLEYAEIIKPILDLPRAKLSKYRAKLKNYAIFKLFDEGKFDVAFEKMIKEHSDYLEDLTALRNIALICLNIAEAKQLKKSNYQEVISVWLTAIYQEKLFVKSLDYTSWDDQYQFTLQNAYGHFDEFDYDDLPDNVNFDNPEENVIVSIREVQRSLMDRFEASISDSQTYHEFYTFQKDAMDALISLNLDNKCTLISPYLVSKNEDIYDEISNSFSQELNGHYGNWEDVISVGVLYSMKESIYIEYKTAKELFSDFKSAISNINNVRIFTASNIAKIKKFNNLHSSLMSFIGSKVSALKSENNTIFKKNFDFYLDVCNSIKDNAISFTFSNYVMHHVVGEVNDKRMKNAEAANYILSIYLLDPDNKKVKDNLKTLFEMLVRETTTASKQAVSTILSKVSGCNSSFYQELNAEYETAQIDIELESILNKFKNNSISKSNALKCIHDMYTKHPNNAIVCQLLAQLCVVCIEEYIIGDSYGSSEVKRILNSLKTNRSSEFNKHTSIFRDRYQDIWKQIPADAKILLSGDSSLYSYGQSLNSKGLALKEGLDYLKAFGGVTNRRSGLFGLNDLPF